METKKQITYSIMDEGGTLLHSKIPANELFSKIPAGARLVAGNYKDSESGKEVLRACYQTYKGKLEIFQD